MDSRTWLSPLDELVDKPGDPIPENVERRRKREVTKAKGPQPFPEMLAKHIAKQIRWANHPFIKDTWRDDIMGTDKPRGFF